MEPVVLRDKQELRDPLVLLALGAPLDHWDPKVTVDWLVLPGRREIRDFKDKRDFLGNRDRLDSQERLDKLGLLDLRARRGLGEIRETWDLQALQDVPAPQGCRAPLEWKVSKGKTENPGLGVSLVPQGRRDTAVLRVSKENME